MTEVEQDGDLDEKIEWEFDGDDSYHDDDWDADDDSHDHDGRNAVDEGDLDGDAGLADSHDAAVSIDGDGPNWAAIGVAAAVLVGFAIRMWALGDRAMHHDESLDAWWSHKFLEGTYDGYDPVYHGPLRFYITGAFYWLFGENAATARLFSALSGTALIAMPWFLRRQLGRVGAVAGAWMFALSPSMLYYSRFAREDMQIAMLTALMLVLTVSYFNEPKWWQPTAIALALSASLAIKESTWLLIFIVGSFVLITLAVQFAALGRHARSQAPYDLAVPIDDDLDAGPIAWMLPLGALLAMLVMVVIAELGVSAFAAFGAYGVALIAITVFSALDAVVKGANLGDANLVRKTAAIGWRWWAMAGFFLVLSFVTMFTVFFERPEDWHSGLTDAISYWQSQQDVNRGSQPWYYYLVLLPAYELLFLVLAIVGSVVAFRRRSFALGLIGWLAAASVIIFSYAGERMPWLVVHPLLPIILLAALGVGFLWQHRTWSVASTVLMMAMVGFLLTAGAGIRASYVNGTDGREFLVQGGQASEQVVTVVDYIETLDDFGRVAERSRPDLFDRVDAGGQLIQRDNPEVAIANSDTWPMAWYFVNREIRYFDSRDGSPLPDSDIIIADWDDFATVWADTDARAPELERLNEEYVGFAFAMRSWWVPEWVQGEPNDEGLVESKVGGYFAGGISGWGDWFVSREAWTPGGCGSLNQWLLIRKDLYEEIQRAESFGALEPLDLGELECVDAGLKSAW